MGRPSTYTDSIAEEICIRLSEGEPLRVICRDDHIPSWVTVYNWMNGDEAFSLRIARARELGREAILEDTMIIADTPQEGVEVEISETGKKEKRGDMLGHRKMQIETRFKLLAKWDPNKYGERMKNELTGAGGGPLVVQVVRFGDQDADDSNPE